MSGWWREEGAEAPLAAARQRGGRRAARCGAAGDGVGRGDDGATALCRRVTGVARPDSAAGSISDVHAIMTVSWTVTPSLKELS